MTDPQPVPPAQPADPGRGPSVVNRRSVVVGAGAAAWTVPLIVAASRASASAVSGGAPAVVVSEVTGVRRTAFGGIVDCAITFTNEGPVDATALSVVVDFVVAVPGTSVAYGVDDVSAPWTSSPYTVTAGNFSVTFVRAGGLAASQSDTLRFTINSAMGVGNIVVAAPTTTPTGANTGATGVWGDEAAVDVDITSISSPLDNGNIFITFKNNGVVVAPNQTVEVTITPTTGTISYSNAGDDNPEFYTVSPSSVAETSSPMTLRFSSPLPIERDVSKSFSFFIGQSGTGTISATVTEPTSANNNTEVGSYL
ncbi:hypothetical protein [Nocardioides sp.]|uniref:hypothetical protein n=1 Tax=Nocardioides sp. TaxID=35761 RepID=UPI002B26DCB2|nr:hypothetical protein [Nocardioides sp.]